MDLIRFVLSKLTAGEKKILEPVYKDAGNAAVSLLSEDVSMVMNRYNGKRI